MLDKWQKKEKPVFTGIARGFGFGGGGGGAAGPTKMEASGGATHTNGGYKYHVFINPLPSAPLAAPYTDPNGLIVTTPGECDILVVSGGGGGGSGYYGGGGGAGTVVVGSNVTLPATTYAVQVGGRGAPGTMPSSTVPASGSDGGKSVFGDIDILGGGFGGSGPGGNGQPGSTAGGNAGGASNYNNTGTSNPYTVPTPYQGYGTWTVNLHDRPTHSPGTNYNGGDGAGGAGGNNVGGVGARVPQFPGPAIPQLGPKVPYMGPTGDYYGGGGGGEGYPGSPQGNFAGGYGGGGTAQPGNIDGESSVGKGQDLLGGGGGGSGNPRGNGGQGGSGIVIVRYQQ